MNTLDRVAHLLHRAFEGLSRLPALIVSLDWRHCA
jgi:hypothetical protein